MTSVYEIVTERIVSKLEQGVIPWRRPWHAESGLPRNLVSGKEYRGMNVFLLGCQGYESPGNGHSVNSREHSYRGAPWSTYPNP
jgi:antirestriction protein ArdC